VVRPPQPLTPLTLIQRGKKVGKTLPNRQFKYYGPDFLWGTLNYSLLSISEKKILRYYLLKKITFSRFLVFFQRLVHRNYEMYTTKVVTKWLQTFQIYNPENFSSLCFFVFEKIEKNVFSLLIRHSQTML
jgi:hypothetical protein